MCEYRTDFVLHKLLQLGKHIIFLFNRIYKRRFDVTNSNVDFGVKSGIVFQPRLLFSIEINVYMLSFVMEYNRCGFSEVLCKAYVYIFCIQNFLYAVYSVLYMHELIQDDEGKHCMFA